eukprot:6484487-Amphidinium_carterae.1
MAVRTNLHTIVSLSCASAHYGATSKLCFSCKVSEAFRGVCSTWRLHIAPSLNAWVLAVRCHHTSY